jgi:hypothetical protein
MKRILSSLVLAGGLVLMGITTASAQVYCGLDPTIKLGLPVTYSIHLKVSTGLVSPDLYLYGTKRTTTFGGGLGIG